MTEFYIAPISSLWLITIGFIVLGLEALTFTFYLIWFGISTIIVGTLSNFIDFENGYYQLITISILSLSLLFILKSKIKELMKPKEILKDEKNKTGKLIGDQVSFEGTLWKYSCEDILIDGDEVEIVSKHGNRLEISKLFK